MIKIRSITKLYETLLYLFIYLLYEYSKCFVQPAAKCKRTLRAYTQFTPRDLDVTSLIASRGVNWLLRWQPS